MLSPLQAAASFYQIAFAPRAGQKVLTLQGAMPRKTKFKQTLCADTDGFNLHTAERCAAIDRQAPEQLCRYITRLVLANERVQTNAAVQLALELKTFGATEPMHLVILPLTLMNRYIVGQLGGIEFSER